MLLQEKEHNGKNLYKGCTFSERKHYILIKNYTETGKRSSMPRKKSIVLENDLPIINHRYLFILTGIIF